MVAATKVQFVDRTLVDFEERISAIGRRKAIPAMRLAINRVAVMARVRVVRAIVKQSSIPRKEVMASITTSLVPKRVERAADIGALEAKIIATGRPLSLLVFGAKQDDKGTAATIYGGRKHYPHVFLGPRPGTIAKGLYGHAWKRVGKARLPKRIEYGPNVPQEMIKGESERAFREVIATHLAKRVEHELDRLLPK